MRVLVVDDYPGVAEISCVMLRILGHDAIPATSGVEALARARDFEPDIVILDIGLPDRNGYDVARALRAAPRGNALHIAVLTGWNQPEDRNHASSAGVDQHFVKPACTAKFQQILDAGKAKRFPPTAPATACVAML
ncbi:MAG: response regulator [Kofleriaceae bacterium]